jgi:hypothetical protein
MTVNVQGQTKKGKRKVKAKAIKTKVVDIKNNQQRNDVDDVSLSSTSTKSGTL